jgi:hypothetical protein
VVRSMAELITYREAGVRRDRPLKMRRDSARGLSRVRTSVPPRESSRPRPGLFQRVRPEAHLGHPIS